MWRVTQQPPCTSRNCQPPAGQVSGDGAEGAGDFTALGTPWQSRTRQASVWCLVSMTVITRRKSPGRICPPACYRPAGPAARLPFLRSAGVPRPVSIEPGQTGRTPVIARTVPMAYHTRLRNGRCGPRACCSGFGGEATAAAAEAAGQSALGPQSSQRSAGLMVCVPATLLHSLLLQASSASETCMIACLSGPPHCGPLERNAQYKMRETAAVGCRAARFVNFGALCGACGEHPGRPLVPKPPPAPAAASSGSCPGHLGGQQRLTMGRYAKAAAVPTKSAAVGVLRTAGGA